MKKSRLLIISFVCAIMLMGIGYAWWNDTVAIGGTATAGYMDVHFENGSGFPIVLGSSYVEPTLLDANEDAITCSFNKLYPNALGVIDAKVVNESTLGVKVDAATIDVTGDPELIANLETYVIYYIADAAGNYVDGTFGSTNTVPISQLAQAINDDTFLKSLVLEPGYTLYFGVPEGVEAPYDLNNDGEKESCLVLHVNPAAGEEIENQSVNFTLNLGWKQFDQP